MAHNYAGEDKAAATQLEGHSPHSSMKDARELEESRMHHDSDHDSLAGRSALYRFGVGSWTQVILVSFVCFW